MTDNDDDQTFFVAEGPAGAVSVDVDIAYTGPGGIAGAFYDKSVNLKLQSRTSSGAVDTEDINVNSTTVQLGWSSDVDRIRIWQQATLNLSGQVDLTFHADAPPPGQCSSAGPDLSEVQDSDRLGPNASAPGLCAAQGRTDGSCNTYTGNEHRSLPGVQIPGRGPGLSFDVAYNSGASAEDGDVGFGWRHSYAMGLVEEPDESVMITQETGATVWFVPDGSGGWVAPDRFDAALVENGDGTWTFTRREFEVFTFDAGGKLVEIADLNGDAVSVVYDGSDRIDYVEDDAGRRLDFGWSNGRLATVTDPSVAPNGPRSITFSYDANGDLVGYNDIGGGDWVMTYYGGHLLESVREPKSTDPDVAWEYHYDAQGRLDWEEDPLDRRTTVVYDNPTLDTAELDAVQVIDPDGDVRIDWYNAEGLREKVTYAHGTSAAYEEHYTFTDHLMIDTMVDGRGKTWDYTYGDAGNPHERTSVTDPLGRTTAWTYNSLGLPLTITDPEGVETQFEYDAAGNVEKVTGAAGTADETITDFVYGDPANPGDVTSVIDGRGKEWLSSYDAATGDLVSETDPEGNTTSFEYNSVGWVARSVAPKGNVDGATPEDYATRFEYNDYGDVTKVTNPEDEVTVTAYDANRNVVSVTDNDGEVAASTYTDADELETRTAGFGAPEASTTTYEYWPGGELKSWTKDGAGTWSYAYDPVGRLASESDPNGNVTGYGYDANSNLAAVTQPGGDCQASPKVGCVSYGYDDANQLTGVDYSDPSTPDVTIDDYDDAGRRLAATVAGQGQSTWAWTDRGELDAHTDAAGRTVDYEWDGAGNLDAILYPGQTTPVDYAYDDAGRMVSVTDWLGNTTSFGYDPNSNLEDTTFPAATGNEDVYGYDRADRVDTIAWNQGTSTLGSVDYDRDPDGLVSGADTAGVPAGPESFGYDARDQLTDLDSSTEYGYDLAGNLEVLPDGRLQVFDPAQQLCWSSPTAGSGSCSTPPADATTFSYDDRGNRTGSTDPDGTTGTYVYDQANRLSQAGVGDNTGAQYQALAPATVMNTAPWVRTGKCPEATAECQPLTTANNGRSLTVQVAGEGGLPAAEEIEAVMLNVTVTGTCTGCGEGAMTVYPADIAWPWTITTNFPEGESVSSSIITRVDDAGQVQLATTKDANVKFDVTGYFETNDGTGDPNSYEALNPARIAQTSSNPAHRAGDCLPSCDTSGAGGTGDLIRDFKVLGHGGVPDDPDVTAVAVNVSVLGAAGDGALLLGATGSSGSTHLAYNTGELDSNMAIVPVGDDGRISTLSYGPAVDIRIDAYGYFTGDPESPGGYHAVEVPGVLMRASSGGTPIGLCPDTAAQCQPMAANSELTVQVTGQAGVPDDNVDAVVVNITAKSSNLGWIGAWADDGTAYPSNIALSYNADQQVSATATIPVGPDGRIKLYSLAAADVQLDIHGYFATSDTVAFTYDQDGNRTTKTSSHTGTTDYTWNTAGGMPLLLTETTDGVDTHLIYGPGGMPIAEITGTDAAWYHQDHLGSTRLVTDQAGNPLGTYTYDPYGAPADTTGTFDPLLDYAGQYTDQETGLQYLRARYYDPNTGQFLTRDPIVAQTMDPYGYALNNPVNATDPTGLFCLTGKNPNGTCRSITRGTASKADDIWDATGGKGATWIADNVPSGTYSVRSCPLFGCLQVLYDTEARRARARYGLGLAIDPLSGSYSTSRVARRRTSEAFIGGGVGPLAAEVSASKRGDGCQEDWNVSTGPSLQAHRGLRFGYGAGLVVWDPF